MKRILPLFVLSVIAGCALDNRFSNVEEGMGFPGYASGSGGGPSSGGQSGTGNDTGSGGEDASGGSSSSGGSTASGGGSNTGGNQNTGGGSSSGGTMSTGGGASVEEVVFDGSGVSIADGSNDAGIRGFFFVLEDSVEDGVLKTDDYLTFSDLDAVGGGGEPSTFDGAAAPCVSGTIARVTAWDGDICYDTPGSPYPCLYEDIWGGGIGLTLNEVTTNNPGAWNASAAGVTGFEFSLAGSSAAQLRVFVLDTSGEQFCTVLSTIGPNIQVDLGDLQHNCWEPDSVQLDLTQIEQITWQFASSTEQANSVNSFCVTSLGVY